MKIDLIIEMRQRKFAVVSSPDKTIRFYLREGKTNKNNNGKNKKKDSKSYNYPITSYDHKIHLSERVFLE